MAVGELVKRMSCDEREQLKIFARKCGDAGDIHSLVATQIMIAHWMRQVVRVGFQEYASQWVESHRLDHCANPASTAAMAEEWPFGGEHHIYPRNTAYYRRKINPEEKL